MKINIKPLSVNQAWQGKRYKTKAYTDYCDVVHAMLPPATPELRALVTSEARLAVGLSFGLSSKLADIDNPVKLFIDCLQRKYGFNDKLIYQLGVEKVDVKKGNEYIDFIIESELYKY